MTQGNGIRCVALAVMMAAPVAMLAAPVAMADGFYLAMDLGRTDYSVDTNNAGTVDLGTATGWRLGGGWRFSPALAVEVALADFGDGERNGVNGGVEAFTIGALGSLPMNDQFSLFARLDLGTYDGTGNVTGEETRINLGGGGQWRFHPSVSLRGGFDWLLDTGNFLYVGAVVDFR